MTAPAQISLAGFTRVRKRTRPLIAIFGRETSGKTALCVSAGLWAAARGKTPGWLITERKTIQVIEERSRELGLDPPLMSEPFITEAEAAEIIKLDRWLATTDKYGNERLDPDPNIMKLYTAITRKFVDAAALLASTPDVEPIIIDSGTVAYNWMAYAHNGRKQAIGQQTKWGGPQSDWEDLCEGLQHKTAVITFRAEDEWAGSGKDRATTGRTIPAGPKTLGYTVTSQCRMNFDKHRVLGQGEDPLSRFSLDVWESTDNKGLSGVNDVLRGNEPARELTFENLMMRLRPEDE